jgi:hypothetical protein
MSKIKQLEMRIARLEKEKSAMTMENKNKILGKGCYVSLGKGGTIKLVEQFPKIKRGMTLRVTEWNRLPYLHIHHNFPELKSQNLFDNDLRRKIRYADYDRAKKIIQSKIDEVKKETYNNRVRHMKKDLKNLGRNPYPTKLYDALEKYTKSYEVVKKAIEVEPYRYEDITARGKDFFIKAQWDYSKIERDDSYKDPYEGMSAFYTTKTRAGARNLWLLVSSLRYDIEDYTLEEFLALAKSKRIAISYVPSVWR